MDTSEYKPNSHASKAAPQESKKPVISGKVIGESQSGTPLQKFIHNFVSKDKSSITDFLIMDVVVPGLKDMAWKSMTSFIKISSENMQTAATKALSKLIGPPTKPVNQQNTNYTPYRTYSSGNRSVQSGGSVIYYRKSPSSTCDYEPLMFENKGDAELLLDAMDSQLEQYGFVSINDMYDAVDYHPSSGSWNTSWPNYGWINLSRASVEREGLYYKLKLPLPRARD